jgi:hypothetical protein
MLDQRDLKQIETMFRVIQGEQDHDPSPHACTQSETIAKLNTSLELILQQQGQILKLVEKHEHVLYGNGKEGLITIMSKVEKYVNDNQATGRKVIEYLLLGVVGGLIVLFVQHGVKIP